MLDVTLLVALRDAIDESRFDWAWSRDDKQHAFLWQNGKMTDLGTLGHTYRDSSASAINGHSQIVGMSSTATVTQTGHHGMPSYGRTGR